MPVARDVHPSRTPMPRAGKALLAVSLLAAAVVGLGLTSRSLVLTIVGGGVLALLTLFILVGDLIF